MNNNVLGLIGFFACLTYILANALRLPAHTASSPITPVIAAQTSEAEQQATTSSKPKASSQPQLSGFCQNVPILMYHHVQPAHIAQEKWQNALTVDDKIFDKQINYLASSGYHAISLQEFAQALASHKALPAKSIVLTFDDGYRDFATYAYPILQKYNLAANLMIPTGLVEGSDYLTWQQLRDLSSNPQVTIYNHTFSHANLKAASPQKISYEVGTAKNQLDANLGVKTNVFAYPYGGEDSAVINILRENGYIAAISTYPGTTQCDSFIMSLHRTRIGNSALSAYGI